MNIPNIHAADELAALREEIKQLEGREKDLRAQLLAATDEERNGDQYRAFVQTSNRESIDKEAIIAALGLEVIAPYMRVTQVKTLKTARKEDAQQT